MRTISFKTPLDFLFWLACINNVFSVLGFAGVLHAQKELVTRCIILSPYLLAMHVI